MVVEYLKTCTSPLVSPTVGYTVNQDPEDNGHKKSVLTAKKPERHEFLY